MFFKETLTSDLHPATSPPFNINTCFSDLVYLYGKHAVNDKSVILILVAAWSSGRFGEFVLNFKYSETLALHTVKSHVSTFFFSFER